MCVPGIQITSMNIVIGVLNVDHIHFDYSKLFWNFRDNKYIVHNAHMNLTFIMLRIAYLYDTNHNLKRIVFSIRR